MRDTNEELNSEESNPKDNIIKTILISISIILITFALVNFLPTRSEGGALGFNQAISNIFFTTFIFSLAVLASVIFSIIITYFFSKIINKPTPIFVTIIFALLTSFFVGHISVNYFNNILSIAGGFQIKVDMFGSLVYFIPLIFLSSFITLIGVYSFRKLKTKGLIILLIISLLFFFVALFDGYKDAAAMDKRAIGYNCINLFFGFEAQQGIAEFAKYPAGEFNTSAPINGLKTSLGKKCLNDFDYVMHLANGWLRQYEDARKEGFAQKFEQEKSKFKIWLSS